MSFSIRSLTEADAPLYRALRLRALQDNPEAFARLYEEEQNIPLEVFEQRLRGGTEEEAEHFTLGAFDETGRPVGMVVFIRGDAHKMRHKGYVLSMYVTPEARGRRVSVLLMEELIRRARQLEGLEQLQLSVVTENVAARALYRRLDFTTYSIEKLAMKLGKTYWDEEHMVLFLREGQN